MLCMVLPIFSVAGYLGSVSSVFVRVWVAACYSRYSIKQSTVCIPINYMYYMQFSYLELYDRFVIS